MSKNSNGRGGGKSSERPRKFVVPYFHWRDFKPSMVRESEQPSLVTELTTYRDRLSELLEREGEYVVIKGQDIIKILPDRETALEYVVRHYEDGEPVLVKKIVEKEPIISLGGAVP